VIALTALKAGQYALVKGSIAGAIVTNSLFMLGASFLLGGLKHRVQDYNRAGARLHAGLLLLAAIALLAPSAIANADLGVGRAHPQAQRRLGRAADPRIRTRPVVLAQDPPRFLRGRRPRRTGRSSLAARPGARHARGGDRPGRAGERDLRRIGTAGGRILWH